MGGLAVAGRNGNCNNGGLLGGIFGGNNGCVPTEKEVAMSQRIATLEAEKYTDSVGISVFERAVGYSDKMDARLSSVVKDLSTAVIALQTENATLKSDIRCLSAVNQKEHEAITIGYQNAVALESERRACGDDKVVAWVQAQDYIKGIIKIDGDQICCSNCSPCNSVSATAK